MPAWRRSDRANDTRWVASDDCQFGYVVCHDGSRCYNGPTSDRDVLKNDRIAPYPSIVFDRDRPAGIRAWRLVTCTSERVEYVAIKAIQEDPIGDEHVGAYTDGAPDHKLGAVA